MSEMSGVAIEALGMLNDAANKWTTAGFEMLDGQTRIPQTRLTEAQAGVIFAKLYNSYKDVPDFLLQRMNEGMKACSGIAGALRSAHNEYQKEEQEGVHKFTNLTHWNDI